MMAAALEFSGVSRHFGSVRALEDVSFAIQEGETVALLGPNGAGKSTAISLLLALRSPSLGTVAIRGGNPHEAVASGLIGAMLQETGLPPGVRVRELVDFYRGLYQRPLPLGEIERQAGIWEIRDRWLEQLSGGERRRALFAMAIAGDPQILFLDEPTVAMDADARLAFWEQIDEMARSGRTILFTTHYLEEADAHAGRILLLNRGRLMADASPEELRRSGGARTISFRTAREWLPRIASILPEAVVRSDDLSVRVVAQDAESIVRTLVQSEVPMQGLEIITASLETALRQLAKEDGQ